MSEHTPKPWHITYMAPCHDWDAGGDGEVPRRFEIHGPGREYVCGGYEQPDGDYILATANSYARHCIDPVAAAGDDLLGQALEVLRTALDHLDGCERGGGMAAGNIRRVLAKTKLPEDAK